MSKASYVALIMKEVEASLGRALADVPFPAPAPPLNAGQAEIRIVDLENALLPFAEHGRSCVDANGWAPGSGRERVCDWFGPSDFRAAAAALPEADGESGVRTEQSAFESAALDNVREAIVAMAPPDGASPAQMADEIARLGEENRDLRRALRRIDEDEDLPALPAAISSARKLSDADLAVMRRLCDAQPKLYMPADEGGYRHADVAHLIALVGSLTQAPVAEARK